MLIDFPILCQSSFLKTQYNTGLIVHLKVTDSRLSIEMPNREIQTEFMHALSTFSIKDVPQPTCRLVGDGDLSGTYKGVYPESTSVPVTANPKSIVNKDIAVNPKEDVTNGYGL